MVVVGYEYFGRPYVIGEAPGRRPGQPLESARRRIGKLVGLTADEMGEMFVWRNLLDEWPGYGPGGGSQFPMGAAREAAELFKALDPRPMILLGRRVARAFGVDQPWLVWRDGVAVCPHPSGLSRWWNDSDNVEAARAFWRTQVLVGGWRE